MKTRILIRWIGRTLFVFSLFLILFWRFSSHCGLLVLAGPFFMKPFVLAFIIAGIGALAMRVSEKMEKDQQRE